MFYFILHIYPRLRCSSLSDGALQFRPHLKRIATKMHASVHSAKLHSFLVLSSFLLPPRSSHPFYDFLWFPLIIFLILCCRCIFSKSSSSRAQLISRATPTATCFTEESLLFFYAYFFRYSFTSPIPSFYLSHPHLNTNSLLLRFSSKKRRNIKCMLCSLRTSTTKLIRLC